MIVGRACLRAAAALGSAALLAAPGGPPPAASQTRPTTAAGLWRDTPGDPARVRIDPIGIEEPSDLALSDGALLTVGDSSRRLYRIDLKTPDGSPRVVEALEPEGLPEAPDLEALALAAGGLALLANETDGVLLALRPSPWRVCGSWGTGISGACFFGRANCGVEAIALLDGGRLFAAKEREPRGAWLFDLPAGLCEAGRLEGKVNLRLPEEVGSDISAAWFDEPTGHLLIVARSRQSVLELELPDQAAGEREARLVGRFSYAATEEALGYDALGFHQVEGLAVDDQRVLYLVVDNNGRSSRRFGDRRAALLRFYPAGLSGAAHPSP